jgi:putative endonuclease
MALEKPSSPEMDVAVQDLTLTLLTRCDAKMFYVYIVRCFNEPLYTGFTTDVARRIDEHNTAKGGRYTRSFAPVKLVWTEGYPDRSSALKREAQIKGWNRLKKIAFTREIGDQEEALLHGHPDQVRKG